MKRHLYVVLMGLAHIAEGLVLVLSLGFWQPGLTFDLAMYLINHDLQ